MKKQLLKCLSIMLCFAGSMSAQTTLISPTGDGGFENGTTFAANNWTVVNYGSTSNSNWFITSAPLTNGSYNFTPVGTKAAYISNTNGASWAYNASATSGAVHLYRDVTFPAGQTNITLSFNWNAMGETTEYDVLYVYLAPTTRTPVTGVPSSNSNDVSSWTGTGTSTLVGVYYQLAAGSGTTTTVSLPGSLAGTTSRLVFTWKNDGGGGSEPPAAIDNISLLSSSCGATPTALNASSILSTSANFTWTPIGSETAWDIYYGAAPLTAPSASTAPTATSSVSSYSITGLTPVTNYAIYVRANCGSGLYSPWSPANAFSSSCVAPNITGTVPGSRCGVGTMTLGVSGDPGAVFNWYNAAAGGTSVATGSVFTTPSLTTTTNFYVTAGGISSGAKTIGVGSNSGSSAPYCLANGGYGGLKAQYLYTAAELISAGFKAGNMTSLGFSLTAVGANMGGFAVQMGTTTINSFSSTNIQGGLTTVYPATTYTPVLGLNTLNLSTPYNWDGISNIIISISWSNANSSNASSTISYDATSNYSSQMYRKDGETAPNMFLFTGSSTGGSGTFDNSQSRPVFRINGMIICEGPRMAVAATLNTPPALSLTTGTTTCANTILALNVTSPLANYDSYIWSPLTNLYTDAGATAPYAGGSATTLYYKSTTNNSMMYSVNATNSLSGCGNIASTTISANTPVINASANPTLVCSGSPVNLNATTNVIGAGIVAIGTGTNVTTDSEELTAFCNYRNSYRMQTVYTAAELNAAGLRAGNITSISYSISTLGSAANTTSYIVKLGSTMATAFTDYVASTTFTTVYTNATQNHAIGLNTIAFTTPYNWDGVSNLVVEVSHNGVNGSANAKTYYTVTSNSVQVYGYNGATTGTPTTKRINIIFGGQAVIQGSGSLTWQWNPGAINSNTATVTPVNTGTNVSTSSYTVTGTNSATTCSNTAVVTVSVNPLPAMPTAVNSTQCGLGVPTASVSGGTIYKWYAGATSTLVLQSGTIANYTTAINATTTWYVSSYNGTCESTRVPVTASVTIPDGVTATASSTLVCPGQSLSLTATKIGTTNTYIYTWTATPATGSGIPTSVTGATTAVTPVNAGTYQYQVTAVDGVCTTTASVNVTLNNLPVINASANPTVICSGSAVNLNATTNIIGAGTVAIGTGTAVTGNFDQLTAFCNRFSSYRMQAVYTAAELTAAGLRAGNITSISYSIATLGSAANTTSYVVKIGATALTALTDYVASTTFTTVYTNATQNHAVGLNTITFTTPYNWDGVSNLVVEVSHNGINSSNNANTYYTVTTGNQQAYGINGASSGTPTNQRLNVIFAGQKVIQGSGSLTWQWNPGAINSNTTVVNPVATGTNPAINSYTVTGTNAATTCSNTAVVSVSVNPLPAMPTVVNSTQCGLGIPTASVSGGTIYKWYAGATSTLVLQSGTIANYTTAINATTTWYVSSYNGTCESSRVPVTATVTVPSAVVASSSSTVSCPGQSITLTATSTGTNTYIYTWTATPAAGSGIPTSVTGSTTGIIPTTAGSYQYLVTGVDGVCTTTASVNVTLNSLPVINASANPTVVCSGSAVNLNATTNIIGAGTVAIGTGTAVTGNTDQLTAFCNRFSSYRMQAVYTAAELTAAGLSAGNITSITYSIATLGSASNTTSYVVKVGATALTALTDYVASTTFTTVYTNATQNHAVGSNAITFTTPYNWDGVSNLVVEVSHNGINSSNNANTYYTVTTGNQQVYGINGASSGTPTNQRLNVIFAGQKVIQGAGSLAWQWNPGAINSNTATVTPVNTGTTVATSSYTITGTNATTTCSNTAVVSITVNPVPGLPIVHNSTQCGYGVPTASVTGGGGTYKWYATATSTPALQSSASATYTTAVNTSTTFYVSEFNGNCEGPRAMVTVTVTTPDAVTASANTNAVCPGTAITLSVTQTGSTNTYTYSWTGSPIAGSGIPTSVSGSTVSVMPTTSGIYSYKVIATDGACSTISTVNITVNEVPLTPTITPSAPAVCIGGSVTISALSNSSTSAFISGTQANSNANGGTSSTTYPGVYTGTYGGQRMQTLILASELTAQGYSTGSKFTNIQFPVISVASSSVHCNDFQVSIGPSSLTSLSGFQGGLSQVVSPVNYTPTVGYANTHTFSTPYTWDGISNVILETTFSNNMFGVVPVDHVVQYHSPTAFQSTIVYRSDNVTAAATASATSINFSYNARPDFKLNALVTTSSVTITWSPGTGLSSTTGASVTANPGTTTVYTVTANNGSCTSAKVFTVTVNPIPTVTVSASTASLCSGTSASLTATGATTYTWMPAGGSASTATVTPGATTVYTVTGTSLGCSNTKTVSINVTATPTLITAASPSVICSSATVSLTATGATNYTWTPGSALTGTTTVTPTSTTLYSVTGANGSCVSTKTVNVTVNNVPVVNLNPSAMICTTGGSATLTASGTSTAYVWSNGPTTATNVVTPTAPTSYTVTGTNSCGSTTATTSVVFGAAPTLSASTSAPTICNNNSAVLTVSGTATSYTWSTGATSQSITVTPTVTTLYIVTSTNACGTASATVVQNVDPCTGLEETFNSDAVSIYPNPAHEFITIAIPASLASNTTLVEVTDAIGKLVMKESLNTDVTTINLNKLEDGVYFFKVISNNQTVKVGKVVKH